LSSVIVAVALTVGAATLVAVTITVFGTGSTAGGVYRPPLILPGSPVPPVGSATVQVTVFGDTPVTVELNRNVVPT
jgi:hypothetical protein